MAEYLDCTTRQVTTILTTLQDKDKYDPPLITVIPFAGKGRQNLYRVNLSALTSVPLKSAVNKEKERERKQAKAERMRQYWERLKIAAQEQKKKLQLFDELDMGRLLPPDPPTDDEGNS